MCGGWVAFFSYLRTVNIKSYAMNRTLEISRMMMLPREAADVPSLLDAMGVDFEPISVVDWPEEFPYRPEAAFRMAWSEEGLVLHYRVSEQSVRALYVDDNGSVWTDSCVECFIRNADSDVYYNMECNCIGTVLVGVGDGRHDRKRFGQEQLVQIARWASLGRAPFEERLEPTQWEVALVIPAAVFAAQPLCLKAGATLRANFYKCGDMLSVPHFVSWNAIDVPSPDFHRPEFFGELRLKD